MGDKKKDGLFCVEVKFSELLEYEDPITNGQVITFFSDDNAAAHIFTFMLSCMSNVLNSDISKHVVLADASHSAHIQMKAEGDPMDRLGKLVVENARL